MKIPKIGSDPELSFFERSSGEIVDISSVDETFHFKEHGSIGEDGGGTVAEARMKPSYDCLVVVNNIRKCLVDGFERNQKFFNMYGLRAGSGGCDTATGGHIHVEAGSNGREVGCIPDFIQQCNFFFLPLYSRFIDKSTARQRESDGYGEVTIEEDEGYRLNDHGFEYRVLPSWLITPSMSYITLQLFQCLFIEYQARFLDFKKATGNFGRANYSLRHVNDNLNIVEKFESFQLMNSILWEQFRKDLSQGKKWNEEADVLETWKIFKPITANMYKKEEMKSLKELVDAAFEEYEKIGGRK